VTRSPSPEMQPRLPPWLKVRFPASERLNEVRALLRRRGLHTVCEEARCPNIGECFSSNIATFMVLGGICTRNCRFCGVTSGRPSATDDEEPRRLADAVAAMGLEYVVITSVTRDDLPDGGAGVFAASIRAIGERVPGCRVEVLIPDFRGDREALAKVVEAGPFVIGHNLETVPRLYASVRPQARYQRSLELLAAAKRMNPALLTKSGLMVGLGESQDEVLEVMADLHRVDCDLLTVGQYLRPSRQQLPVERFYPPEEFYTFVQRGREMGFRHVEAGPLVRSSYHAERQTAAAVP
jgi:lipoyl synthase